MYLLSLSLIAHNQLDCQRGWLNQLPTLTILSYVIEEGRVKRSTHHFFKDCNRGDD